MYIPHYIQIKYYKCFDTYNQFIVLTYYAICISFY